MDEGKLTRNALGKYVFHLGVTLYSDLTLCSYE